MGARRQLIVSILAAVLSACGCTTAGCGGDIRIDVEDIAEWVGTESFVARLCAGESCEEIRFDGFEDPPLMLVASGRDDDSTIDMELTVTMDHGTHTARGTIALERHRPNGRFCPPVCGVADITPVDDQLVNAAPGQLPPR